MPFLRWIWIFLLLLLPPSAQASVQLQIPDCSASSHLSTGLLCSGNPARIEVQQGAGGGATGGQRGNSGSGANGGRSGGEGNGTSKNFGSGAGRDVVRTASGSTEFVVVVDRSQAAAAAQVLQGAGAVLIRQRPLPQFGQRMLFFTFPRNLSLERARSLLSARVPSATLDFHHIYRRSSGPRLYHAAMVGDDPGQTCRISRSVRVGIIDGPVNPAHPVFRGVQVVRQSTLTKGERRANANHGTAVGGLIAGSASAGPLSGMASGVRLYAAETFSNGQGGDGGRLENVAAGLDWLTGQGVRLVNMSFSGATNRGFEKILSAAASRGVVMVAAAGNNRSRNPFYPAASPNTIAVTAVDASGRVYHSANSGSHMEFAAPGVDLYVAWGGGGSYRSGTSFAAPVVTSLLARQAARGGLSLNSARRSLRNRARDLGPGGRDSRFGYGLVQSGGC